MSRLRAWPHWPWVLWAAYGALLAVALVAVPRLPQNPAYHDFADTRALWGLPRFGDVASNLALLAVGVAGLVRALREAKATLARAPDEHRVRALLGVFFAAVTLTAFGSAYYHWVPDTPRLIWDRLPIGLAAAAFPAVLIADRVRMLANGWLALRCWLVVGPLAAAYWHVGETAGLGDLRPYLLVQAVALGGTAALLILLPAVRMPSAAFGASILLYAVAMACEQSDGAIFAYTGFVSGHTIKHLLAAGAAAALLFRRSLANSPDTEPAPMHSS